MKYMRYLLLVVSFFLVPISAQPAPQPPGVIDLGVVIDEIDRPLEVGETITVMAHKVGLDPDTYEAIVSVGFVGYTIKPADPGVVVVRGNSLTGELRITALSTGTSAIFSLDKNGEIPYFSSFGGGQLRMVTVAAPERLRALHRTSTVLVHPVQAFAQIDEAIRLKVVNVGEKPVTGGQLVLKVSGPAGDSNFQPMKLFFGETVQPGKSLEILYRGNDAEVVRAGQYLFTASVLDASGKALGVNRFEVAVGEYPFPGRFGKASLERIGLNSDYRTNERMSLFVEGEFPKTVELRDVRVYLNGKLISEPNAQECPFLGGFDGSCSRIQRNSHGQVVVGVAGIHFPAAVYKVILFEMTTGQVFFGRISVGVDEDNIAPSPYNSSW